MTGRVAGTVVFEIGTVRRHNGPRTIANLFAGALSAMQWRPISCC